MVSIDFVFASCCLGMILAHGGKPSVVRSPKRVSSRTMEVEVTDTGGMPYWHSPGLSEGLVALESTILPVGATVAFWSPNYKRFMRMPSGRRNLDKSRVSNDGNLPPNWIWEQFRVVDGGDGLVGLWSPIHKRFIRMPPWGNALDKSSVSNDGQLPARWAWERFQVVDGGNGTVALWNPTHKRFMRMPPWGNNLDKSHLSHSAWGHGAWERFKVVSVSTLSSTPQECNANNKGSCDCAQMRAPAQEWQNMKTYTWSVKGQQRCVTMYKPPNAPTPMPVMMQMAVYARDSLNGSNGDLHEYNRFQMAKIFLSSPDGGWDLGYTTNDAHPMRCTAEDSKDILYVKGIFHLMLQQQEFDQDRVYTKGFSQNSMFAAHVGFCFADKVKGIYQSGGGLATPEKDTPGKPLGAIARTGSMYWPVYPCRSEIRPVVNCIASYFNDGVIASNQNDPSAPSHPRSMYNAMMAEGHDPRMLLFGPDSQAHDRGGHRGPANEIDWVVGCLGITETCSQDCEHELAGCMQYFQTRRGRSPRDAYSTCMHHRAGGMSQKCPEQSCAPTLQMLTSGQDPVFKQGSGKSSGPGFGPLLQQPSGQTGSSKCVLEEQPH